MKAVAIIPARGGSVRLPRKNILPFFGKPVIAYSIEVAEQSGLFDKIVVATDDMEIAKVATEYGATVWMRPSHLSEDHVGPTNVAGYTLMAMWKTQDVMPEYCCCILATAPLMSVKDLKRGAYAFLENPDAPYAYACALRPQRTHDLKWDAAQFYWGKSDSFIRHVPLDVDGVVKIVIDDGRVCDINTEEDWSRAVGMYRRLRRDADPACQHQYELTTPYPNLPEEVIMRCKRCGESLPT